MADIFAEHAAMRHLADCAERDEGYSTDDIMSLADAMAAHERTEARIFALPFLPRAPKEVSLTAAKAQRRCIEYTSGDYRSTDSNAAAARFVEALLAHLSAEETWLAHEKQLKNERLMTSI
jgi:hypothetical protein